MIADWRAKLPGLSTFGFVQIAAYTGYGGFSGADLRQSELAPVSALPKIAFATPHDCVYPWSAPGDIHPTNKQCPSQRLANQILSMEYGKDTPSQTPLYAGATTSTDGTLISVTVSLTGCVGGCAITAPWFVPPGVNETTQAAGFMIQTNDPAVRYRGKLSGRRPTPPPPLPVPRLTPVLPRRNRSLRRRRGGTLVQCPPLTVILWCCP